MPTYDATDRYGLRALTGSNPVQDIDVGFKALRDDVSAKMVGYSAGTLASRPTSTVGTPGIAGRLYRATDTNPDKLYQDNGTGWDELVSGVIRGGVDIGGGVYAGSGFTVTSDTSVNPGIYTVVFTAAFSTPPIVVAMATEVGYYVSAFSVASSQASLRVRTDAGALANASFMFIAMPA